MTLRNLRNKQKKEVRDASSLDLYKHGTRAMRAILSVDTKDDFNYGKSNYGIIDSSLDNTDFPMDKLTSFFATFQKVIDAPTLKEYIESKLENKKGEAVGIEFGGLGIRLFRGFSDGFFKKTMAVSLSNLKEKTSQNTKKDYFHNKGTHHLFIGNIFDKDIYKKIKKEASGVDLIIEKMIAGWDNIPKNPMILSAVLQMWWDMLNVNGIILAETPIAMAPLIKEWEKYLQNNYPDDIDIAFDNIGDVLRIIKLSDKLSKLPKLNMELVKKIMNCSHY